MTLILPTPEIQARIRKIVNEDEQNKESALESIKLWLKQQPHLPDTYDEMRLLNFLRGSKFSVEKCKKKLDTYFTMKAKEPKFFTNRDMRRPELQALRKFLEGAILPKLTEEGYRISIGRCKTADLPEIPDLADIIKLVLMAGDLRISVEKYYVAGDIIIIDTKHVSFKHLLKMQLSVVKNFLTCIQDAFPVLVHGIHLVHVSPFITHLANWLKPLMKDKIFQRMHMHEDLSTLYNFVPKELLPEEYGGNVGKMADLVDDWNAKMIEWAPWFEDDEKYKADESKRPETEEMDEIFGIVGSFKQLLVD